MKEGGVYHGMREKIGNGNNEKIKQCNENRRMNMKKIIAILLTTLLVMQLLVGCGSTTKNEENNTDTKNNEITEGSENLSWAEIKAQMPEDFKGTEITVYSWNDANAASGAVEAIQKFERETGIKVNWVTGSYNDYTTKVSAMVTGGDSPDIVRLRDTDFAMLNMLTPLNEIDYDFSDQAWNHELMKQYQVNGKYYAAILDNTPYFQPMVMYYNRNLITKYNLEDPYTLWQNDQWTWDKCMEMCSSFLSEAGTNYHGLTLFEGADYAHSLGTSLISYDSEQSQYVSHMSEPELIKGWQFVATNIAKGLIMKDIYRLEDFESGNVLFCTDANIGARTTHFYFQDMKSQGSLGVVPVPAVDGQEEYYQTLCENEAYGIAKGAKNAEAAAYFLRYYLDAAHYDMDTFYCDDQAAEVTEWCKQQTFVTNMERIIFKEQYGTGWLDMSYALRQSDPAQIKTILDTYQQVVNQVAQTGNKSLSKLSE